SFGPVPPTARSAYGCVIAVNVLPVVCSTAPAAATYTSVAPLPHTPYRSSIEPLFTARHVPLTRVVGPASAPTPALSAGGGGAPSVGGTGASLTAPSVVAAASIRRTLASVGVSPPPQPPSARTTAAHSPRRAAFIASLHRERTAAGARLGERTPRAEDVAT